MALDTVGHLGGFEAFGDEAICPPTEIAETQFRHQVGNEFSVLNSVFPRKTWLYGHA